MPASICLLMILLQVLCSTRTTTADLPQRVCEGGDYTADSSFNSNLQLLLQSLLNSSTTSTFTNLTEASTPGDTAYGLYLCRGDISLSECQTCIQNAVDDVYPSCDSSKRATLWYDKCELRYSDICFFSSYPDNGIALTNYTDVTDTATFNELENELEKDVKSFLSFDSFLPSHAAYKSSLFATGKLQFSKNGSIYGLIQCTRDLSESQCSNCIDAIFQKYLHDTDGRKTGTVVQNSCSVRYETDQFFEGEPMVYINLLQQSTPAPPNSVNPRGRKSPPHPSAQAPLTRSPPTKAAPTQAPPIQGMAQLEEISSAESLLFDLSVIRFATSNFSEANMLGQGGFGSVYKGTLHNRKEIAVKRLSTSSKQGIEELKNELVLVAKLQHKNLVRLLGICLDEEEKLLVYEYVPNRSLDTFLFDPIRCEQLNWERRFKIIGGIAQGLLYLHEQCHLKVVHRDLKASNILLDEEMNPKISDFGLSRLFGSEETQCTTSRVMGTFGYMAPEYAMRGQFSIKSDVYSFGVLVLEIVTGRKKNSFNDSERYEDLLSYTWDHWDNGKATEIIDPSLSEDFSTTEVMTCIQIGLLCTQNGPSDRPLMSSIIPILNKSSVPLSDPTKPTFCSEMTISCSSDSEQKSRLVLKNGSSSKRSNIVIDPR